MNTDNLKNETPADAKPVLAAGLSDEQKAEATIEFMNLFRQMLNEARFFSHDERSLRGYLIEDIEKKKLKAEEFLKTCR